MTARVYAEEVLELTCRDQDAGRGDEPGYDRMTEQTCKKTEPQNAETDEKNA